MKKRRFLFPFLALLLFAADSLAQSALFAKRTDLADFDGEPQLYWANSSGN